MMTALISRLAGLTVVPVVAAGLLTAPAAAADPAVVGHLAYLTSGDAAGQGNRVELVNVFADGTTSPAQQIGPVTTGGGWSVRIYPYSLVASTDGDRLAWSEELTKGSGNSLQLRSILVMRDETTGTTTQLRTVEQPAGFAGHRLVVASGGPAHELVTTPSPHLVRLDVGAFPLTTYAHGVVSAPAKFDKAGTHHTDTLQLRSFGGHRTVLHVYRLGPANYRDVDAGWLSADGNHLVVERGNHQDFGGLGPSSLADEFGPAGADDRRTLGHYGTAKAAWRIESVGFVGTHDDVWAAWVRQARHTVHALVARYAGGHWQLVRDGAIALATRASYVLVQPGQYVPNGSQGGLDYRTETTGPAVLSHAGSSVALDIAGIGFAWVSG